MCRYNVIEAELNELNKKIKSIESAIWGCEDFPGIVEDLKRLRGKTYGESQKKEAPKLSESLRGVIYEFITGYAFTKCSHDSMRLGSCGNFCMGCWEEAGKLEEKIINNYIKG